MDRDRGDRTRFAVLFPDDGSVHPHLTCERRLQIRKADSFGGPRPCAGEPPDRRLDGRGIEHEKKQTLGFHATFGLGDDDKHLAPADAAGVALAAIQGVYEVVQEKDNRIAELESENAALAARLARLEAAVAPLLD